MYDETTVPGPEYRVRTVVRYVVTRYCHPYTSADGQSGCSGQSTVVGEFHDQQQAFEVAQALAKSELHSRATVSV